MSAPDLADLGEERPDPTFACTPIHPNARTTLHADVMVTITNLPVSVSLMLTNAAARELAFTILRRTEAPTLTRKES